METDKTRHENNRNISTPQVKLGNQGVKDKRASTGFVNELRSSDRPGKGEKSFSESQNKEVGKGREHQKKRKQGWLHR